PVHAVRAEHVRDLVRVDDDGGRAEREDEPGELVHEQLRGLEVHVCVDEPGNDPPPGCVELFSPVVVAQSGDDPVADGDVGVEPLAGEDGEHLAAADDEIGRLVAAPDRETAREIRHSRPTTSSGRTGTRASSRPVASRRADTIAAVEAIAGGSPTPLAPYGASGSATSTRRETTGGMSRVVGIRESVEPAFAVAPSRTRIS